MRFLAVVPRLLQCARSLDVGRNLGWWVLRVPVSAKTPIRLVVGGRRVNAWTGTALDTPSIMCVMRAAALLFLQTTRSVRSRLDIHTLSVVREQGHTAVGCSGFAFARPKTETLNSKPLSIIYAHEQILISMTDILHDRMRR